MAAAASRLEVLQPVIVTGLDVVDVGGPHSATFATDLADALVSPEHRSTETGPVGGQPLQAAAARPRHAVNPQFEAALAAFRPSLRPFWAALEWCLRARRRA